MIEILNEMSIPIVIFNNISVDEEKQLFFDLNDLSTKPSRSAKIRLSQTDMLSQMARELSEENVYLKKYGVEYNKPTLHLNNPNTVLLTTVYEIVSTYIKAKYQFKEGLKAENFEENKKQINKILNQTFEKLPKYITDKEKYILSKGFALRAIFSFIVKNTNDGVQKEKVYAALTRVDWSNKTGKWIENGAHPSTTGVLQFPPGRNGGYNIVIKALNDALAGEMKK